MSRVGSTRRLLETILDRPAEAAVSCSFQAGGVALLHMLRHYRPDIPVLFVDTGYHFPETLRFRDHLAEVWDLDLRILTAELSVPEQAARHGPLNRTDPDRCCTIRKVEPLYRALEGFDLWITGVRHDSAPTRVDLAPIERKLLPSGHVVDKASPLLDWTLDDVLAYHHSQGIPLHPLYDRGYRSIGCGPCTEPVTIGDPRSGRWSGFDKTECGLHTQAASA